MVAGVYSGSCIHSGGTEMSLHKFLSSGRGQTMVKPLDMGSQGPIFTYAGIGNELCCSSPRVLVSDLHPILSRGHGWNLKSSCSHHDHRSLLTLTLSITPTICNMHNKTGNTVICWHLHEIPSHRDHHGNYTVKYAGLVIQKILDYLLRKLRNL